MAAKKTKPAEPKPPAVPKEAEQVDRDWCCPLMRQCLNYANTHNTASNKRLAGLQVGHVFSPTGGYKYSPIVYVMPARGRGKAQTPTVNALVDYCPFCGHRYERP